MNLAASAPTILDAPESRFPLELGERIPKIRDLFHVATRQQWNPATDIAWDELDASRYSDGERYAARMYWSRRAWGEYGAISESPALQIRFCQEKHAPDMRLFFAIRSQEEARHAEACYRMAEGLGGYFEEPAKTAFQGSVATHGVRKLALDPESPLECVIAALVCAAEEIAFDLFRHLVAITPNPVARQVLKLIMRDEVRHCAFGWHFMSSRAGKLSAEQMEQVRQAVIFMIEKSRAERLSQRMASAGQSCFDRRGGLRPQNVGSRIGRDRGRAGKADLRIVYRSHSRSDEGYLGHGAADVHAS